MNEFERIGRFTDKDILNAVQDVIDNCKFLTKLEKLEHYDFEGAAHTTISITYLTQRNRE